MSKLNIIKNDENTLYIREFILYLGSDKGCRPRTLKIYRQDLEEFQKNNVTKDLLNLKESEVREYKFSLVERKLAPRTINRKLSVIRSFYKYFVDSDNWDIKRNPATNVATMRVPKTEPIVMSESQAQKLLDGILLTGNYVCRDYAIFATFLFTGVRVSELIKLKVADLDFDSHILHVRDGKGGKDRSIPMVPKLEFALKVYLSNGIAYRAVSKTNNKQKIDIRKCGREYFVNTGIDNRNTLFLTKIGNHYSEKGIEFLFKNYTKNLGIYREKLSLHAMRRSCLTYLYKQGVDVFILKEISGHVRITTLENYLRIDKSNVLVAMNKHPLATTGIDMNLVDMVRQ